MNKPIVPADLANLSATAGPLPGSRKFHSAPEGHDDVRVPFRAIGLACGKSFRVYDTSGPYTDPDAGIDVRRGLSPLRRPWIEARGGVEAYAGRAVKPEDNGTVGLTHAARAFASRLEPLRGLAGPPVTQLELARAGIITQEMVYVAHRENIGRQRAAEEAEARLADGESFGASLPSFVTPEFVRSEVARGRAIMPAQHQSSRERADDHRPQLPHQDQRQYRQLRRHLVRRGGGGEDGVGDPLGGRHRHGPLHRPQHPHHAGMDHPQRGGTDRDRAHLSGAGEGRRRSGQARLGGLSRYADRAGRAGRGLFHHPCRGATRLHPSDRPARDGDRVARRVDHGQMVPRPSPRELPL